MIYHLSGQMASGHPPKIFTGGEQKRDHIYVRDCVLANLKALEAPSGIYNVGRYFNIVTPELEQERAQAQEKARQAQAKQAQESQPMDPSKAYLAVEAQKRTTEQMKIASEARNKAVDVQFNAIAKSEELDIKRDELIQNRQIKLAEIAQDGINERIKSEQASNERVPTPTDSGSKKSA